MSRPACLPLVVVLLAALAGCAAPASTPRAPAAAAAERAAPVARTIDDTAALRRCMDDLLVDYGTRDLSVAVEDSAGGTRELLTAAVSGITQRSRAVRVLAGDGRESPRPQYTLRGSLRSEGAGAELDLALLQAEDRSVVPGSAARTVAAVRDGRVELRKFGALVTVPAAAGQRALADLAVIELFGRVARVPYWSCFGAGAADPAVAAEVQDWYDTMAARPAEIIGWFQQQLRQRRLYDGPLDGNVNPPLKDAVARYREALGLSREPKLSLDLFQAYLAADHRALAGRIAPAAAPAPGGGAVSHPVAPRSAPLELRLASASERYAKGEAVRLAVTPSRDAHVWCFHQDEGRRITRFFPNRFQRDSRIPARSTLQLPGAMRFEITMNARGVPEAVACYGSDADLLPQLPPELRGADFSPLPVASFDQLRSAFLKASGGPLAEELFAIRAR